MSSGSALTPMSGAGFPSQEGAGPAPRFTARRRRRPIEGGAGAPRPRPQRRDRAAAAGTRPATRRDPRLRSVVHFFFGAGGQRPGRGFPTRAAAPSARSQATAGGERGGGGARQPSTSFPLSRLRQQAASETPSRADRVPPTRVAKGGQGPRRASALSAPGAPPPLSLFSRLLPARRPGARPAWSPPPHHGGARG